jgi:hypothetical protein
MFARRTRVINSTSHPQQFHRTQMAPTGVARSIHFTLAATAALTAAALSALPASADAADDASLLPGDVRVWELNHPAGVAPTLLPGDVRVWELNHPAGVTAAP